MKFAQENLPLICLSVALIITFLYGRYQYLTGYLKACKDYNKDLITNGEKEHYGNFKYLDGYTDGFNNGVEKHQEIIEKAVDNTTGGWIDEAVEWRKIAQEFIINISKAKQNE